MATTSGDRGDGSPRDGGITVLGDIGGTHARFAVCGATAHDLHDIRILRCEDYADPGAAIDEFVRLSEIEPIGRFCLAVAGPVDQDWIDLPNNHWSFSRSELGSRFGVGVEVINDFTAQAMCIDALEADDLTWFGPPRPVQGGIRTILGPGTGLGIAFHTPDGTIIPSEGGHVGFAPVNEHEIELMRRLLPRFRRVSVERLLSGPGLENIYRANREIFGQSPEVEPEECSASEISRRAADGDALALRSIQDFLDILATFAGDVALFTWSTGGLYLSGGVLRKLAPFVDVERFRARFSDKGRFTRFCEKTAVAWITHETPGLLGCAATMLDPEDQTTSLPAPFID